jgi:hypothetical protein
MSPNSFQLQEVRALDLLTCILNFYRSCLTAPVLREAIRVTYGSKSEPEVPTEGGRPQNVKRLEKVVCRLMAQVESPDGRGGRRAGLKDTVSRVLNGRGMPEMTACQKILFTQVVEEFQEDDADHFGAWILRRTGLDQPPTKGRAIFLVQGDIRSKKESVRKAALVQYGTL